MEHKRRWTDDERWKAIEEHKRKLDELQQAFEKTMERVYASSVRSPDRKGKGNGKA